MRGYFFTNFYLSSIQKGIQAQHCTADMAVKYHSSKAGSDGLRDLAHDAQQSLFFAWARDHKVTIVLNGGAHGDLEAMNGEFEVLVDIDNKNREYCRYPYALFREDEVSLNHAATCFGIVLPESIYDMAERIRKRSEPLIVREMLDDPEYVHKHRLPSTATDRFIIDKLLECNLAI